MPSSTEQFVGMTLLFREERPDADYAVLLSYVRPCTSSAGLRDIASEIGSAVVRERAIPTEYLGIADVFAVSGPAAVGAALGTTTYPEWTSAAAVEAARVETDAITLRQEQDRGLKTYCADLGFLGTLAAGDFTGITSLTLVRAASVEEAEARVKKLAAEADYTRAVLELGTQEALRLELICVLSLARIDDGAIGGGPFQHLIHRIDPDEADGWDIHEELLHPHDLLEHFDEPIPEAPRRG